MSSKRTYFRPTTPQQRQLLFQVWQETGSVTEACKRARVSRSTFYHWKTRFEEGGYAALTTEEARGPRQPQRISAEIEEFVIRLKRQNPTWGKRQIANHLKQLQPRASIAPGTVRRILMDAGL